MTEEDKLFALVLAALSNSGTTASKPEDCATRAVLIARAALKQLKELNDTNH